MMDCYTMVTSNHFLAWMGHPPTERRAPYRTPCGGYPDVRDDDGKRPIPRKKIMALLDAKIDREIDKENAMNQIGDAHRRLRAVQSAVNSARTKRRGRA